MNDKQAKVYEQLSKTGEVISSQMIKKTLYVSIMREVRNIKCFDTWKITVKGKLILIG